MSYSSPDNLASMVQANTFIIEANRAIGGMIGMGLIPAGTPIRDAVPLLFLRMSGWAEWQLTHGPSDPATGMDSGVMGLVTAIDPENPPACVVERLRRDLGNWGGFDGDAPIFARNLLKTIVLRGGQLNGEVSGLTRLPVRLMLSTVAIPFTTLTGEFAMAYCLKGFLSFDPIDATAA